MNRETIGKEETEKSERNGHIRMMAQHNGPQRHMKLKEELQVTETNKRGEKFDLKVFHLKRKVHSKHTMKAQRRRKGIFINFL
jgi:hypothetical protein